jgi:ABC-type multidrug transport system ATPase subunit
MAETNISKSILKQFSSFEEVDMGGGNNDADTSKPTELHLRWARLQKYVIYKDETTTLKGRISKVTPNVGTRSSTVNKVILDGVSGEAKPGEILATMGPSGSGKTSLMNVLSGRAAYQEGTISINGKALDKHGMKRLMSKVAYVKQHDVFFETLTVTDQLTYTAQLRFPDDVGTKKERQEKIRKEVERIIKLLRLTKVADSPIMMCSGGEIKRVNIGTELLTDPSIIMLDEPTSGLDSASAISLLDVLKDLAKNHGKTIITSIHQPNSATFLNTFDKLLMLSDGHTVFFGTPNDSIPYLRSKGYACPEGYNAADHWMDLLVIDSAVEEERKEVAKDGTTTTDSSKKNGESPRFCLQKAWDNDAIAEQMDVVDEIQTDVGRTSGNFEMIDGESKYATKWWTQFSTLTHRALKKSKSTVFSPINLVRTIAIGIIVGIVYLDQKYTENDVFNIYAYFFFAMLYWVFNGMFDALFAFPQERVVIQKERATASYRLSAYFASATVADLPVFLVMPCIYMTISFWMVCPSFGFVTYTAVLCISFLSVMTGQALGFLIGASFDDPKIGQSVATVCVLFLMLLGGFFAKNIPSWLSWVVYISPFAYASNAAMLVIFRNPIPCDGSGALSPMCAVGDTTSVIPVDDILQSLNVFLPLGWNIALLIVYCLVPRVFTYAILRRKKGGERE